MLKIENIKLPPGADLEQLTREAARILRCPAKDLRSLQILRRSIDAREEVSLVYTVEVSAADEGALLRRCRAKRSPVPSLRQPIGFPLPCRRRKFLPWW